MNLAKQGFQAYSESQGQLTPSAAVCSLLNSIELILWFDLTGDVSKTGGEEYNAPSHSNQGDYQGGQGGGQGFRPNSQSAHSKLC
jgi:hypothetical protein